MALLVLSAASLARRANSECGNNARARERRRIYHRIARCPRNCRYALAGFAMSAPTLPGLFGPSTPRAHKRVRQVSREIYRRRRADDVARAAAGRETKRGQALRIL